MLTPPTKKLRAEVIREHMNAAGLDRCVVFSCGNAARELRVALGAHRVLSIAPGMDLDAQRWFTQADIARHWPDAFDGTSGHLPWSLMNELSRRVGHHVDGIVEDGKLHEVACGSGETVMCLRMAFPRATFLAVYDDSNPATRYDDRAPLAKLVEVTGPVERRLS